MKSKIKIFSLLYILILMSQENIYSQNVSLTETNVAKCINKYWYYRDRLKYFVIPGDASGEGIVAGIRNIGLGLEFHLNYDEEAVYLGYYIGVLATEFKLLSDIDANYEQTKRELYYALNAYINQMDKNEQSCYPNNTDSFDGFFVRTTIPDDFIDINNHKTKLNDDNKLTIVNSKYNYDCECFGTPENPAPKGKPGYINIVEPTLSAGGCEDMSQDQAIGLLTGLALVSKFVPNQNFDVILNDGSTIQFNFYHSALQITDRIVNHMAWGGSDYTDLDNILITGNCNDNTFNWFIRDPNCNRVLDEHGGNVTTFSHGFAMAASSITGQNPSQYNYNAYTGLWGGYQVLAVSGLGSSGNDWMASTLAAIGNSWGGVENINTVTSRYNWEPFYDLLWAALHDQFSDSRVQGKIPVALQLLDGAPCDGPYCYTEQVFGQNGWCTSYRWHSTIPEQENTTDPVQGRSMFRGNYNGLDYMLLLNLYLIATNQQSMYNTRPVDGYEFPTDLGSLNGIVGNSAYPVYVASKTNIVSNSIFHNYVWNNQSISSVANATYKAVNQIILKPGFKVEPGAYFHAFISDDITCYDIWSSWKTTTMGTISDTSNSFSDNLTKPAESNTTSIIISPNPNSGNMQVNYEIPDTETGTFIVYDILGKTISSSELMGGKNSLSISLDKQRAGIYFYKAFANNKQIAADKIVVIK